MNPVVGSSARYGAVVGKVHQRIFLTMKRSDDGGGGVMELPGTKVG